VVSFVVAGLAVVGPVVVEAEEQPALLLNSTVALYPLKLMLGCLVTRDTNDNTNWGPSKILGEMLSPQYGVASSVTPSVVM